jgi:hypothetical protein
MADRPSELTQSCLVGMRGQMNYRVVAGFQCGSELFRQKMTQTDWQAAFQIATR